MTEIPRVPGLPRDYRPPGVPIVRRFPFEWNSGAIATTGYPIYTPTIEEHLLSVWIETVSPFNGDNPIPQIGTFVNDQGWLPGPGESVINLPVKFQPGLPVLVKLTSDGRTQDGGPPNVTQGSGMAYMHLVCSAYTTPGVYSN